MKNISFYIFIVFLLASCQKEKLPPVIDFSYTIAENGILEGLFTSEEVNYQIDFGDGTPVQVGKAFDKTPVKVSHKYSQKRTFSIIITVSNNNGTSTQKKQVVVSSLAIKPDAIFNYENNKTGSIKVTFNLNEGDSYELDFGDNFILKDSAKMSGDIIISHQYGANGSYIISLKVINIESSANTKQTINISGIIPPPIANFSYEVLENGKVKFTNLSKNPQGYKWRIGDDFTYSNSGDYFYTSTEKDPIITIDLNGNYQVRLSAEGDFYGNADKEIGKTINVKSAKSEMTFIGLYNNNKVIKAINGLDLKYSAAFGGGAVDDYGFYQKLWLSGESNILNFNDFIYSKFYPLPYNRYNPIEPTKEDKYNYLKKYLTQINDPDIIEVTEETLDPLFYNNTENFYPKAFWVRYKVKNETLDGELKVRIMVYGSK